MLNETVDYDLKLRLKDVCGSLTHGRGGGPIVSAFVSGSISSRERLLGLDTLISRYLSPPRCINGYRRTQ